MIKQILFFTMEDTEDYTSIFTAVVNKNYNRVKNLLNEGHNFLIQNREGNYPIHIAATCGCISILRLLVNAYPESFDVKDKGNRTPLTCAALRGNYTCVVYLLGKKADINACDIAFITPLIAAAIQHHSSVARLLIKRGADVNVKDLINYTALHHIVGHGDIDLVNDLLEAGASVDCSDMDGWTPFYMAVLYGYRDVAYLLAEKGADVNKPDYEGVTPLMRAREDKNKNVLEWLMEIPSIM